MKIEKSYSNLRETGDVDIIQRFPKGRVKAILCWLFPDTIFYSVSQPCMEVNLMVK